MDKPAGPPNTGKPTQVLKRDYRILRAKVLKILDQKFFRPSDDVNQYDAKMTQMKIAFKKIRDEELVESLASGNNMPKIYDYNFYEPNVRTLKYSRSEKGHKTLKELENLKIDNLCKFLSPAEIELICEDPIYFLGREEYRVNSDLNDHKGWSKQLILVEEKKRKEDNWKETMERYRDDFNKSPLVDAFDHMVTKQLKSPRDRDFDARQKIKDSILRSQSKKIMARNNQMNSLVKIRRLEEGEHNKAKQYEWNYNIEGKCARVLDKKKEALDMIIKEKQQERLALERKLQIKEKERQERHAVKKITQEIDSLFKGRFAREIKAHEKQIKVEKAKTYSNFKLRKPQFLTKVGVEPESEGSEIGASESHF